MIEPGTKAPAFTLPDQDGNDVSLSDFADRKVVIAFYPQDFSESLRRPALGLPGGPRRDQREGREALIGISVDSTHAHRAFRERLNLKMTLLSDFHPKGVNDQGLWGLPERTEGHANRSLVLVDEDGAVEWVHEADTPLEIPGANLIFDALEG